MSEVEGEWFDDCYSDVRMVALVVVVMAPVGWLEKAGLANDGPEAVTVGTTGGILDDGDDEGGAVVLDESGSCEKKVWANATEEEEDGNGVERGIGQYRSNSVGRPSSHSTVVIR